MLLCLTIVRGDTTNQAFKNRAKVFPNAFNWNENFSALNHDSHSRVYFSSFEIWVVLGYGI